MSILEDAAESDQRRELLGLTCNSCNKKFVDEAEQKMHYKSEWHRYNLKRKVAGVPGVTEALFLARQSALAEEENKSNETPMSYSCGLCGKGYRSSKAHAQHLNSKSHWLRASQGTSNQEVAKAIIKPLPSRTKVVKSSQDSKAEAEAEESEEESDWEEVDSEDDLMNEDTDSLTQLKTDDHMPMVEGGDDSLYDVLVPTTCFMCDLDHDTIESCMVHMHKQHGFFIPDVEYLKDPEGLLTYLGLKVKRDYTCLYCNERRQPFNSLEAVRKHMEAKSHCKVRYGDGGDDEEAELEEFYDYSSSYKDDVGGGDQQMIEADGVQNKVELGGGGSELIITRKAEEGISTRILGSREFLRYYRQKPRPTPANNNAITAALASRYRTMGLTTVQSREHMVRLKVLRTMNKSGVEAMRSKIGMKSNVIRNLPNNVPY